MTPAQWRLSHRVPQVHAHEFVLTEPILAERFGASVADVHRVAGPLIGRRQLDTCWTGTESYLVLPPGAAELASGAGA